MKKVTLDISGMHCASCATLITNKLKKEPGISYANVNLTTEKATVEFDESKTSDQNIVNSIEKLGDYKAKIITDDEEDSFRSENAVIKIVPLWKWLLQF